MQETIMSSTHFNQQKGGMTAGQWLLLAVIGLAAWRFIAAQPAEPSQAAASEGARNRDYLLNFHAHQMFRRGANELDDVELDEVRRWFRCLSLMTDHQIHGLESLSKENCQFVVRTLNELCPDFDGGPGYRKIYESCANRLSGHTPAAAAVAEHRSPMLD